MADSSSSNAPTSTTDAADRLYPRAGGNQGTGNNDSSGNSSPEAASPHVVTNMTDGKTVYFDPNTGECFEMETRNDIMPDSKPGADDPYWGRITGVEMGKLGDSYGTAKIHTDDPRGRIIHGGVKVKIRNLFPIPMHPARDGCRRRAVRAARTRM